MRKANTPKPESTARYKGVTFVPERVRIRKKFANLDDPKVARAYDQACEERADVMGFGEADPVNSRVPAFYTAAIFLNGKPRHLGCAQKAEAAARLYDAALFHLWGFVQRGRNPSRFNFYKLGDVKPEFSFTLQKLRRQLRRELIEKPLKDKDGNPQHVDNYDFNFLNEQNQ